MSELSQNPDLKEINAYKKKLNWGDVPAIYHMAATSIGELDGIISHGFDSAYKRILNRNTWNLTLLGGYKDAQGNIEVKTRPQIALRHHYCQANYELHCYPIVDGVELHRNLFDDPNCPFTRWYPDATRMLFRISSLVSFMIYSFQSGDKADMLLIKYAYLRVKKLIDTLNESFDIVSVKGYNIAEFYQELHSRKSDAILNEIVDSQNEQPE